MNLKKVVSLILACGIFCAAPGLADDSIRTHSKERPITGQVMETSPTQVKIDKGGLEDTIPVNDIISITFEREPFELTKGRNMAVGGQYAEALAMLNTVDRNEFVGARKKILDQDLDFYLAYCTAKLALGGAEDINKAGKMMLAFADTHTGSHHSLAAAELMGDLYVAVGTEALHSSDKARQAKAPQSFEKAMERYAAAGNAPWAGADAGLSLKRGQALLAQNKTDEASKAFQAVISGAAGPQAEALKMAAQLGRARALAASNQAEEGVKLAEDVIAKAPKNDEELNGQAYLALGACHRAANKPHEAVLAYLHVDLLYSQNPQIHAEALAALSKLWATLNRPDRARAASAMLADKYPNSYWNR